MDKPATPQDLEAVRRAAQDRAHFMRWIAEKLLVTDDKHIRREAAEILRQLAEEA